MILILKAMDNETAEEDSHLHQVCQARLDWILKSPKKWARSILHMDRQFKINKTRFKTVIMKESLCPSKRNQEVVNLKREARKSNLKIWGIMYERQFLKKSLQQLHNHLFNPVKQVKNSITALQSLRLQLKRDIRPKILTKLTKTRSLFCLT